MKTFSYIIVETQQSYNNVENYSGVDIITNSSIESVKHINRIVKVVSAPDNSILEKDDLLLVHHNILRERNGIKGQVIQSDYYLYDNMYFVPFTEVFMYKRGMKEWESLDPFCFVKPVKKENKEIDGIIMSDSAFDKVSHKGNLKRQGIITFINKELKEKGVNVGDYVFFTPYSEYEFEIDNEIYYKMQTKDILLKR